MTRAFWAAFAALAAWAGAAPAQEWFSAEACRIGAAAIDRRAYPVADEARLQARAAEMANPLGRFWKITAPGGQVSHLWGTFHTPDPQLLALPAALRAAIDGARIVALEADPLPDTRDEARAAQDADWIWVPWDAPPPERGDLPPRVLDWVRARLEDLGWTGADYVGQLSDAGLASFLVADPCGDFLAGVLPGQDGYIAQEAFLAGAGVTGLQAPGDFGRQLTDPSRAAEARAILIYFAAFLGPESADRALRETLVALYLQGRLAEMDMLVNAGLARVLGAAQAAEVVETADRYLLVERNGFFTLAARPLLDAGGALIAVGAAHLPGETGMVEMLRDAGYLVERVPLPGEAM